MPKREQERRAETAFERRAEAALERNEQGSVKREFFTVNQAEVLTGVSRWTWRSWAYAGKIASTKLGKRLLIPASEIQRLIAEGNRPRVADAR